MMYLASQSTVKVENVVSVEGTSQIDRTMDVTVNGQRTVIHKTTPGSDTLTVQDGIVTHTESSSTSSGTTPAPQSEADEDQQATTLEKMEIKDNVIAQSSPSSKMKDMSLIEYLFRKFFRMFRR